MVVRNFEILSTDGGSTPMSISSRSSWDPTAWSRGLIRRGRSGDQMLSRLSLDATDIRAVIRRFSGIESDSVSKRGSCKQLNMCASVRMKFPRQRMRRNECTKGMAKIGVAKSTPTAQLMA
ncbi:hypothetical protein CERSUDRAFT_111877 [Gelatoporia subvermispora B]|uniref:Uncharacterized protein n=1 Tax=Ceriporiopsis subvermispora (strain B) TaxID=914234 RepID=M2RM60_CERS8|nr:hypothetical protein CERSUDRAFT_111877 [Gelatoporia subvermispora B]